MVPSANKLTLINFNSLPPAEKYGLALSGGMDSMALLHLLATAPEIKNKLFAIHVNHHINTDSNLWAERCQLTCDQYNVPLTVVSVELSDHSENAARKARQAVFKAHITDQDCLLTAHHLNDQAETILFRFLRGTGLKGLTGMSLINTIDQYQVCRPLLHVTQADIQNYVVDHNLLYVNDPSNQDNRYSRNHLRNKVIPVLKSYENDVIENIELTATNLTNSLALINHLMGEKNPLDMSLYNSKSLLATALYHWLNAKKVSVPSHKRLQQFAADSLAAEHHKNPLLHTNDYQLTRWQNSIYALRVIETIDTNVLQAQLIAGSELLLPGAHGKLLLTAASDLKFNIKIKFNHVNENIQLNGHKQHKKLKNLFQEMNIPPWQRKLMPYVFIDDQLMAVGSDIISQPFEHILTTHKAEYHWLSEQVLL